MLLHAPAVAYTVYEWAKDGIPTCFTQHPSWTTNARNSATSAIESWEASVDQLDIAHNTDPSTCSISGDVEMNWTDYLPSNNGTPRGGTTILGASGPIAIVFARCLDPGCITEIDWHWHASAVPEPHEHDFTTLVLHEVGHALGLQHPEVDGTYPSKEWGHPLLAPVMDDTPLTAGDFKRIQRDDRAGGYWLERYVFGPDPEGLDAGEWDATGGADLSICGTNQHLCIVGSALKAGARTKVRVGTQGIENRTDLRFALRWKGVGSGPHEIGLWVTYWPHVSPSSGAGAGNTTTMQCPGSTTFTVCYLNAPLDDLVQVQDVEIWIRNTGPGSEVRVDYVRGECPIFINPLCRIPDSA